MGVRPHAREPRTIVRRIILRNWDAKTTLHLRPGRTFVEALPVLQSPGSSLLRVQREGTSMGLI